MIDEPWNKDNEEEKTPQQEPPEGEPDLLPELSKQTVEEVIRKEIKEKQQPINKIQTWDKYLTREEAEKLAKEKNLTLKDFEKPAIMKQITFKQVRPSSNTQAKQVAPLLFRGP